MKIEKIKKMSNGKYKIEFDNQESLLTYDEVILNHQLLFDKQIDSEKLNELNNETSYYALYNKVLKYIQKRIRSKKEIIDYLNKNDVEEKDRDRIVLELTKNGWLNDESFCKAFVSDKFYLSNIGPERIRRELQEHNIDYDIIDQAISEIKEEMIYEQLYKLIDKKVKANHKYARGILKQKILSYYLEQGYTREMILSIFDEVYKEDTSILEKEASKIRKTLSKKYSGKELDYHLVQKLYQKGFLKEEIDKIKEES
jgi:regulatory protein